MGKFTEQVQSGAVAGPLRRNFTPAKWNIAFASVVEPDEGDRCLYQAALVIHSKLENIRACLTLSSSSSLSPTTKLRAFVAGANHNYLVAKTKTQSAIEKATSDLKLSGAEGLRPEQLAAQIKLELKGGFEWSPDEVVESLADGMEVPVRFALKGNPSLAGNPRMNEVEWADVALEINLGVMFKQAEDLWDDCLWNDYRIVEQGPLKVFIPHDLEAAQGYAVGHVRRFTLGMGYQFMAKKYHRELMARGLAPRIREVQGVEQQGRRQVLKLSKPGQESEALEELFVMRGLANEPYYVELLEEPLESLGGLTLSAVLDAWMVISRSALVLVDRLANKEVQADPDSPAHVWLPTFAPVLQTNALIQALHSAAHIKPADGKRLIEFFTFRGQAGQEIWASPLVPVGVGTVAPVFPAVMSPNLRRLVDVWMRQLGIDLARRGPAFEAHLRSSVIDSIRSSKILAGHAAAIKDDYTFRPPSGRAEQIDVLFAIGTTVFVGEAKCILEPTEAKGIAMHRKTVLEAAGQARRKAQCLTDNREAFVADARRLGMNLPIDFKVVHFVVVSSATHVGISADGVPVVDEYILDKFIEGELEDIAFEYNQLRVHERVKTIFYTDVADAQAKAPQYFARPPQVERLLEGLKARMVPIHKVADDDWRGLVLTVTCTPTRGGLATKSVDGPADGAVALPADARTELQLGKAAGTGTMSGKGL